MIFESLMKGLGRRLNAHNPQLTTDQWLLGARTPRGYPACLGVPYGLMTHSSELIARMPKAELHLHLDGCLRLDTIVELAEQQNLSLPVPPERLAERCVGPEVCRDLLEVLSYFALPVAVLQTPDALERVTYELCEDVRAENVRYLEIRFAPSLHCLRGMSLDGIILAVVRGWDAGRRWFGLAGGIILCGMRHLPPEDTLAVAQAGLPYLGNGVVGFDLAGDEANYPILLHRDALRWARDAGYGMTAHAGEAAGAQSVRDAVEIIGVSRVGHGVHSYQDASLVSTLREQQITLEMCPTSNLQTRSVSNLAQHPLYRYYRDGLRVTVNTDNRTVSGTDMTRELLLCHEEMLLSLSDLADTTLTALRAGFANADERQSLEHDFKAEMAALGMLEE